MSSPSPIYFYDHKFPFNLHSLRPPCQTPQKEWKMTNQEVTYRIKVCAAEKLLLSEGTGRGPSSTPRHRGRGRGRAGRGRLVPLARRLSGGRPHLQRHANQRSRGLSAGPSAQEDLVRPHHPEPGSKHRMTFPLIWPLISKSPPRALFLLLVSLSQSHLTDKRLWLWGG